jgi:hypothetical protein
MWVFEYEWFFQGFRFGAAMQDELDMLAVIFILGSALMAIGLFLVKPG